MLLLKAASLLKPVSLLKKVAIFTRLVALAITFVALVSCGQKTADEKLQDAERYLSKGEINSAAIVLKDLLSTDSNNAPARLLLGKTAFVKGDFQQAEKELTRALELGMDPDQVLPWLARAHAAAGSGEKLEAINIENLQPLTQAEVVAARVSAKLDVRALASAEALVEQAVSLAPESEYVMLTQADLFLAQGEQAKAVDVLNSILAKNDKNGQAWERLGDIALFNQNIQEAIGYFSNSIEHSFNDLNTRFKRGNLYSAEEDTLPEANKDLAYLKERSPKHPRVGYLEGLIRLKEGRVEEAKSAFTQSVSTVDYPPSLVYLARINWSQDLRQQALDMAKRALRAQPGNPEVIKLAAAINLNYGNFSQAEELLESLAEIKAHTSESRDMLVVSLTSQGKVEKALAILETEKQNNPDDVNAYVKIASIYVSGGDLERAVSELNKALLVEPTNQAANELMVHALLKQGERDKALTIANDYRQSVKNSAAAHLLLATVYDAMGDVAKSKEALNAAITLDDKNIAAYDQLADLYIKEANFEKAKANLRDILAVEPKELPALLKLAGLEAMTGDMSRFKEHLEQAIEYHPAEAKPRILLGRYYFSKGEYQKTLDTVSALEVGSAPVTDPMVLNLLGRTNLALKNYGKARRYFERLNAAKPNHALGYFLLSQAYAGTGDLRAAKKALDKAISLRGDYLNARLTRARLALASNERNLTEVGEDVELLVSVSPGNPEFLTLQAKLLQLQGRGEDGVNLLRRVYAEQPNHESLNNLTSLLNALGHYQQSVDLFNRWLETHPKDNAVRLSLAKTYQKNNQIPQANAQYKTILATEDNVLALNNLAWNLRKESPADALDYIERAIKSVQDPAVFLDTRAMIELEMQDYDKARSSIGQALILYANNPTFTYHRALIESEAGNRAKAMDILARLLRRNEDFPEKEEAKALLERL